MKKENTTITLKDINDRVDSLAKIVKDIVNIVKELKTGAATPDNKTEEAP